MKPLDPEDRTVKVPVIITATDRERLQQLAQAEDRTFAAEVRRAIRIYLTSTTTEPAAR